MADIHTHTHTCAGNKNRKTDNEILLAMWYKNNSLYELNSTERDMVREEPDGVRNIEKVETIHYSFACSLVRGFVSPDVLCLQEHQSNILSNIQHERIFVKRAMEKGLSTTHPVAANLPTVATFCCVLNSFQLDCIQFQFGKAEEEHLGKRREIERKFFTQFDIAPLYCCFVPSSAYQQ
ncbi:hypothetical protein CBL_10511 [Carabus blaptoides fortunei]